MLTVPVKIILMRNLKNNAMKKITFFMVLLSTVGCAQVDNNDKSTKNTKAKVEKTQHRYGGWYCPDNLNGFPPVDVKNWANVPVISDRLPTKEETQSEASLMYIDPTEYPLAKALDIQLPQLATYYSNHTKKNELVIVIQAVKIDNDSIVGFRYLNGGNGSCHLSEVNFMAEKDIADIPSSRFVSHSIRINNATQDVVWKVLTDSKHLNALYPTFNVNVPARSDWRSKTSANYYYTSPKNLTSTYADMLFGCFYVQNDYLIDNHAYVEKFILLENKLENYTELKIVCGPYLDDFESQKSILQSWASKVNELSLK